MPNIINSTKILGSAEMFKWRHMDNRDSNKYLNLDLKKNTILREGDFSLKE